MTGGDNAYGFFAHALINFKRGSIAPIAGPLNQIRARLVTNWPARNKTREAKSEYANVRIIY